MIDLLKIKNIAIVGLSPSPTKDSHKVAQYLQNKGYEIFPIYPKKEIILGKESLQNISDLKDLPIDLVVIFRKSQACFKLTQEIIQLSSLTIKGIWLQLGIINNEAKSLALQHHLDFVQNQCIKIEREKYES